MMKDPARVLLTRRSLLAGACATLAAIPMPAIAQMNEGVDIAIVGGGAAGIAAARMIAETGRSYVLLEAGGKLGGRARTLKALGHDIDMGVGGFARSASALADFARASGQTLISLPSGHRLFTDGHEVPESGYDAFALALGKARRDILDAADAGRDGAAASVIAAGGPWAATVAALMGPLSCGRPLGDLSTLDLASRDKLPDDTTSPAGIGAMLEAMGAWLNVHTEAPVSVITNAGRFHTLTLRGQRTPIRARAIILAVPAPVLAAGTIRFNPGLPVRLTKALSDLPAGALEQVAFVLPGNPLGLSANERVLVKAGSGTAPPALLRGRVNGSDLHVLTFGDTRARAIAEGGEATGLSLARAYLQGHFGLPGERIEQVACSNWTTDPLIRGALIAARPGAGAQRRVFADTVQNRIFLAGDYTPTADWGTLGAAWNSGEAAAARALRLLGNGPA